MGTCVTTKLYKGDHSITVNDVDVKTWTKKGWKKTTPVAKENNKKSDK